MIDKPSFFHEVTLRICSSLQIEVALSRTFSYISEYIPVDEIYMSYYDYDRCFYKVVAKASAQQGVLLNKRINLPQDALHNVQMMNRNQPLIVEDWRDDPVIKAIFEGAKHTGNSCLILPLTIEEHRIGVLQLFTWGKNKYNKEHGELLFSAAKPFSIALQNALKHQALQTLMQKADEENRFLKEEMQGKHPIIGKHAGLKEVYEMVQLVAPLKNPILLLGETGTGKEVVAREIHHLSERRNHLMVSVNCGAIPQALLDSELFGHEKGAFTGADAKRPGYFERANKGTIFLDEIGELTIDAQVRLLRVIQEQEFERVGGAKPIQIDTRVICATHRNLPAMIEEGGFREDLYFRINVFPIVIPPLRERPDDIPLLVDYFIEAKSKELGIQQIPAYSTRDMEELMQYQWPGNVRELQNVVERSLILSNNGRIRFTPFIYPEKQQNSQKYEPVSVGSLNSLDSQISSHIRNALTQTKGKINGSDGAAELLGIHPNTLRNRMKKLDIDVHDYKK